MSAPARNLLDVARRIRTATIFTSGFHPPEEVDTLEAAAARLRELVGPGELSFTPGRADFPDLDPFWLLGVRPAGQRNTPAAAYFADRWTDELDVQAAQRILQKLLA